MKYINKLPAFKYAVEVARNSNQEIPTWAQNQSTPPEDVLKITQKAIDVYLLSQKPNGTIEGNSWWQTANGYTAIALHAFSSGNIHNYDRLLPLLHQCEKTKPGFINEFNDDSLWWALCCLHMYPFQNDHWSLSEARDVWQHVSSSVCRKGQVSFKGEDMEGAVFWTTRPNEDQLNAITTGLYAELSVRLALLEHQDSSTSSSIAEAYIQAAMTSLSWILRCRYKPTEGLVLDHINLKPPQREVDWMFTYNTAVTLAVSTLLYDATGEEDLLVLACHMAQQALHRKIWVESDGVLTERGAYGRGTQNPLLNNDAVGFKSVLVRHLCTLRGVVTKNSYRLPETTRDVATMIETFVRINFRSQVERNTDGRGRYGPWWAGPFESPTAHSQMAVLDVMSAAVSTGMCREDTSI